MAESISEGTLSSYTKQVGDHVEQDEEIASIETDKIDVSVNAPEAGTITELLASEGDTVTVGQDIAKLEPGEGGGGGGGAAAEKKEEAPKEEKPAEPKKEEQPKKEEPQAGRAQAGRAQAGRAQAGGAKEGADSSASTKEGRQACSSKGGEESSSQTQRGEI